MNRPQPLPQNDAIIEIWQRLADIRAFSFTATPGPASATGWCGQGNGTVRVEHSDGSIRFFEHGRFVPMHNGAPLSFRNVYHWRWADGRLSLSHERFGNDAPVWLFDLIANENGELVSVADHHCGADIYRARLVPAPRGLDLHWLIHGPRKSESLVYHYRFAG